MYVCVYIKVAEIEEAQIQWIICRLRKPVKDEMYQNIYDSILSHTISIDSRTIIGGSFTGGKNR